MVEHQRGNYPARWELEERKKKKSKKLLKSMKAMSKESL